MRYLLLFLLILSSCSDIGVTSFSLTPTWEGATSGQYPDGGFTKIILYKPVTAGDKTYNHHARITNKFGRTIVMFSTHHTDEEGIGMWVRYTYDNGDYQFISPTQLFKRQDIVLPRLNNFGRVIIPMGFALDDAGNLYAVGDVCDRDYRNGANIRIGIGIIARQINPDMTLGGPFWITGEVEPRPGQDAYSYDPLTGQQLINYMSLPGNRSPWGNGFPENHYLHNDYTDGTNREVEVSEVQGYDAILRYWRYDPETKPIESQRFKHFQYSLDGVNWQPEQMPFIETPIPDSYSLSKVLRKDSTFFFIGNNQSPNRNPLFLATSNDGLNWGNVVNVANAIKVTQRFPGHGKGGGFQYPDAIYTNQLLIVCSVRKEDIVLFRYTIEEL